ncbi:UPF0738 family protein [Jeotgalibacillus aurantiacus]|uniref:UPF0738 family protein n=1 Tax=Jeotgalibacillus aurantiacus TaxID=2763266 RepID=UPI001D0B2A6F|nr:hypothetical protein [Jeotgalibacillus aurantiacus]
MIKKVWLTSLELKENECILTGESNDTFDALSPAGKMIVDSDERAFVYLADEENSAHYTYLYIPDFLWTDLKRSLSVHPVYVSLQGQKLELKDLEEEIEYLISNIEGNSNYGEEMVKQVEDIFLEKKVEE